MKGLDPRKVFSVGGSVRDELMGLPAGDHDYVVVGSTPEEMLELGFRAVGKDFPVFLHPKTHAEYALARTERKTEPGYHGFVFHAAPDVTLEQDLARRDLTINAMARDMNGTLIDPYHGHADLQAKFLRHVSPAFVEDPVRILRVARLAARFPDFSIAPETRVLMWEMVDSGEVDYLVPERVWHELAKGLMEARPSRMFESLRSCSALERLLPEINALFGVAQHSDEHPEIDSGKHVLMAVDIAARLKLSLPARFATLCHDIAYGFRSDDILMSNTDRKANAESLLLPLCARLRVPVECRSLAVLAVKYHEDIHRALSQEPAAIVDVLERCDAFRRAGRFDELLGACEADYRGHPTSAEKAYPQARAWRSAAEAARSVDAAKIADDCAANPEMIPEKIRQARILAIEGLCGVQRPRASEPVNAEKEGKDVLADFAIGSLEIPAVDRPRTSSAASTKAGGSGGKVKRKLTSILAVGVADPGKAMCGDGQEMQSMVAGCRRIIETVIEAYDGRFFKTDMAGANILAEFSSPEDAVRSAIEIQETLTVHNDALPTAKRLQFRIGINLGDVMVKDEDLLGDGVNVAVRLESIAEPGGVYISASTYEQIVGKVDQDFTDIGEQRLKNITHPVRVYKLSEMLDIALPSV